MPGPPLFIFLIFLALFSISATLFVKSLKRRIPLQIAIFTICFLASGWLFIGLVIDFFYWKRIGTETDIQLLQNLKKGDSVIFTGTIGFRCNDPYDQQKVMTKPTKYQGTDFEKSKYIILMRPIKFYGRPSERQEFVHMPPQKFEELINYLEFKKQVRDTISYELKIKVKKASDKDVTNFWDLIEIIRIDSLKKIPFIENAENCLDTH